MEKSKEVKYCTELLQNIGNSERMKLLKRSNLTIRERSYISARYVVGLSVKECAEKFYIEPYSFLHIQKRICEKLYRWLEKEKMNN